MSISLNHSAVTLRMNAREKKKKRRTLAGVACVAHTQTIACSNNRIPVPFCMNHCTMIQTEWLKSCIKTELYISWKLSFLIFSQSVIHYCNHHTEVSLCSILLYLMNFGLSYLIVCMNVYLSSLFLLPLKHFPFTYNNPNKHVSLSILLE